MNWNQLLEDAIMGKLIGALVDDGYRVQVSDQDGGGLFVYAMPDGKEFPRATSGAICHWAKLVPGNGPDMISDYSTNLEKTLKPVNEFAAQYQQ